MVVNGISNVVNYGTCSTAAATAAKVVSCSNFALITGAEITVKFTTTNTAANPTLNVNNTGAKAIYYRGSAISAGYLAANRTYTFRYNGTQYELVGDLNTDTNTKVTQTVTTSNAAYPLLLAPSGQTATTTTTSYFDSGVTLNPSTNTIVANISGNATTATKATQDGNGNVISSTYLPLSAGQNKKLTGPLGLTENINYGKTLPSQGFEGQLFFLEDENIDSPSLPTGGITGQVLVKNSSTDGDASWTTDIAGNAATATKATQDGNGNVISSTYLPLSGGTLTGYLSLGDNSNASTAPAAGIRIQDLRNCTPVPGMFGDRAFNIYFDQAATGDWQSIMHIQGWTNNDYTAYELAGPAGENNYNQGLYYRAGVNGSWQCNWKKLWMSGDAVTGAVWNDYAECRESDCEEFGYVLMETGDDSLTKTTERLSHFAGVSSDTWGFSQGETDKAKTPIAVAGRVLVYPYQDRNNYKPGDCVCAAPGGTVDIMTREEVREWPDRIVGTVSCVPDYEEWGGGEGADRDPIKVNGRIWIKVR